MGDSKFAFWLSLIVGPFFGGFAGYFISASVLAEYSWCISGEEHCIREWIGAMSGWVAIGVAVPTIHYLRKQISEQKKQTAFQLGDAAATLDSIQDLDDPEEVVLRLVNWNRRGLLVKDVGIVGDNIQVGIMDYKYNDKAQNLQGKLPFVRGWEDRSRGPNAIQFKLSTAENNQIIDEYPLGSRAYMDVQIIGSIHENRRLICFLHPQES